MRAGICLRPALVRAIELPAPAALADDEHLPADRTLPLDSIHEAFPASIGRDPRPSDRIMSTAHDLLIKIGSKHAGETVAAASPVLIDAISLADPAWGNLKALRTSGPGPD